MLTQETFIPCKNISDRPLSNFKIDPLIFVKHYKQTTAIIHSHVTKKSPQVLDIRSPSITDLAHQKKLPIPWLIYGTDGKNCLPPVKLPRICSSNYLGRPFIWFIFDCYTLVQDYYFFEKGIKLADHKIDKEYRDIRQLEYIFEPYIQEYGFKELNNIEGLQNGDLFIVNNGNLKRNHLVIFHNGKVLNQDTLSIEEPLEKYIGRIEKRLIYVN